MTTTDYFQATFDKAHSGWTYTLNHSIAGKFKAEVSAEQEVRRWHKFFTNVPEELRKELEKEVTLHHDTLVASVPGTLSKLSALMTQSPSHEIYQYTTGR
jgi:hypothetical protein